ncbi:MAG TPA: hypothetical protein VHE53_05580 [Patescibacteria group bacterium]|nr:hypothetical protein [Patescibacteria group bacterium]
MSERFNSTEREEGPYFKTAAYTDIPAALNAGEALYELLKNEPDIGLHAFVLPMVAYLSVMSDEKPVPTVEDGINQIFSTDGTMKKLPIELRQEIDSFEKDRKDKQALSATVNIN